MLQFSLCSLPLCKQSSSYYSPIKHHFLNSWSSCIFFIQAIDVIHKNPNAIDGQNGEKKGETIGDIEKEMMQLINENDEIINNKLNKKLAKKPGKQQAEKHLTLTDLDKQAEQEVDFLTNANSRGWSV